MYKEKFASEIEIGDSVLFEGGKYLIQITGTARYRENEEDVVCLYTAISIQKVPPDQVFQVAVYSG
jgi:hypothetical protein